MLLITQLSEANNFLFVYPCGSLSLVFIPSWNAGVCCQPGIVPPRDDIEFARQMILVLACRCRNGVLTAMWCQLCSKSSRTSRTSTPVVSTHRVRRIMPALCNLQFATCCTGFSNGAMLSEIIACKVCCSVNVLALS